MNSEREEILLKTLDNIHQIVRIAAEGLRTQFRESKEADLFIAENKRNYQYPEPSYDLYFPGFRGQGIICHVVGDAIFYMVDTAQKDNCLLYKANICDIKNYPRLSLLPAPGIMFGIVTQQDIHIIRVIRMDTFYDRDDLYSIYYLDTGEVKMWHKKNAPEMYTLPEHISSIPAQALKCKLLQIDGNGTSAENGINYLKQNRNVLHNFDIVAVENKTLLVNIFSLGNDSSQMQVKIQTNPFLENGYENPFLFPDEVYQGRILKIIAENDEETLVGDDDVAPVKELELVKVQINDRLPYPEVGGDIRVIPTSIESVDCFWAHIEKPVVVEDGQPTLGFMQQTMNGAEIAVNFKMLRNVCLWQLVFAKYLDYRWYRARVIEHFGSQLVVLFVDYGNTYLANIENLREWDDSFDYMPFQAVRFRIANIQKIKPLHPEACKKMEEYLLNKTMTAKVVNIRKGVVEVNLYDKDDFDMGSAMVIISKARAKIQRAPLKT